MQYLTIGPDDRRQVQPVVSADSTRSSIHETPKLVDCILTDGRLRREHTSMGAFK
jgi:hypothetical protein